MLRVGTASRAVPSAADLGRNRCRAQRLLGAPVGGVHVGIDENAEEHGRFDLEMAREALHVRNRARIREQVQHLVQRCPRATSTPCAESLPAPRRSRTASVCWRMRVIRRGKNGLVARAGAPRRLQFVFQPRIFPFEARPLQFDAHAQPSLVQVRDATAHSLAAARRSDQGVSAQRAGSRGPEFSSQYESDAVTKYDVIMVL